MGLGRYPALTLRDARNIVADLRESADKGIDPPNAGWWQQIQE